MAVKLQVQACKHAPVVREQEVYAVRDDESEAGLGHPCTTCHS